MPLPDRYQATRRRRCHVLVTGIEVPGAALLAGIAALRAGAGRLEMATCSRNATAVAIAIPEAFVVGLPETVASGIEPSTIEK
jgi:NAD(P)H-hydrate repair Nnr-like enzyme with NAD(P)H-hydrate dehydratase domain